jgi:lipoprotein signal peptidase
MSQQQDDKLELAAGGHVASHLRFWIVAALAAAADLVSKQWVFGVVGWPDGVGGMRPVGGVRELIAGFFDLQTVYNPNAAMGLDARVFSILAGLVFLVTGYGAWHEKGRRRVLYAASAGVAAGFAVAALLISATSSDAAALAAAQRWLFVAVMAVIGLVFVGMFWLSKPTDRLAHVALGLVIGGDAGNLYDRIVHHFVRDFLKFTLPVIGEYPSFNLADAFLVVGVALLILTRLGAVFKEGREKRGVNAGYSASSATGSPHRARSRRVR